jgi:hypothetical protein
MTTIGNQSRPAYVYDAETDTWVPIGFGPHSHDEYIDKTIVAAKGDLIVATANDTVARLAVGVEGSVLVADPTAVTGLAWGEAGGSLTVSTTAPLGPEEGDLWFNSTNAITYVYYDNFWVEQSDAKTGSNGTNSVVAATSPITYNSGTQTVGITQSAIAININQVATTVSTQAAGYTILAADENTFIRSTSATAVTMTINNVLNIGESVQFIQFGAGQITFAAGSGVALRSVDNKLKTNKQYSVAAITCVASGEYLVTGDLVA